MPSKEYDQHDREESRPSTKPLTLPVVELGPITSTVIIIGND